jgi:hypothetical protein
VARICEYLSIGWHTTQERDAGEQSTTIGSSVLMVAVEMLHQVAGLNREGCACASRRWSAHVQPGGRAVRQHGLVFTPASHPPILRRQHSL